jgi:hypothetical protein
MMSKPGAYISPAEWPYKVIVPPNQRTSHGRWVLAEPLSSSKATSAPRVQVQRIFQCFNYCAYEIVRAG